MFRATLAICGVLLVAAACDGEPLSHADKQVLASVQVLRRLLGNPDGLKIVHADQYSDGAICYTYRVGGDSRGPTEDVAVYDGEDRVTLASIDVESFTKRCLGRNPTRNVTEYANYGLGL